MRVLIVGSGGREHALAWWCRRDRDDVEVIAAPGNGGTADIAENVPLDPEDAHAVARLARGRDVDLVVIGPDAAAAAGVADACTANGIAVFGPTAAAARIESSKSFAKELMDDAGIPTARWLSGGADERESLLRFVHELRGRCVVKADGLALGKGVTVSDSVEDATQALQQCFDAHAFGDAGTRVVVEERLHGPEVSVLAITDGTHVRLLPPVRDHKRALDGDRGPNTGGMGAISPPDNMSDVLLDDIARRALQPCVDALRERGTPFTGCLYAGVILTPDGPQVLEFNARFGDPEAQVLLPMLAEDAIGLLGAAAQGSLQPGRVSVAQPAGAGVVAAARGYPGKPRTGDVINGLDAVDPDALVFHAGTRRDPDGTLRTSAGRVLCVVATGARVDAALECTYENLSRVHFDGMQYRRDIGATMTSQLSGTRS
ncbi:MAG: phosphoribosylamine--glycine ligase [Candidatus Dormibacteria bacterium]